MREGRRMVYRIGHQRHEYINYDNEDMHVGSILYDRKEGSANMAEGKDEDIEEMR